ncbi:MAG: heterodisulfide reductase-related iron-sulfur binding cluster [Myxococcota bacterium]
MSSRPTASDTSRDTSQAPGDSALRAGHPGDSSHGVFDALRPPAADQVADCVHCGFCLPACPTYALWGQEMDSPRGRIHLIKLGLSGEVAMDETFRRHFDRCLGCMSCMSACPSGVQYEPLLEATRAQIERQLERDDGDHLLRRALLLVMPRRWLLRLAALAAWLYQRLGVRWLVRRFGIDRHLPPGLRAADGLLPDIRLSDALGSVPAQVPAHGPRRLRVGMIAGCVQSVFFRRVNQATIRVLAAEGCDVSTPDSGCCGALAVHAGHDEPGRAQARAMIAAFEDLEVDRIAINAAGCGAALKHYPRLFADEPAWRDRAAEFSAKVRDVLELLDELGPRAQRQPLAMKVAYHDACHLSHVQGVRAAPRRVLGHIPGLAVVEVPDGEMCCGSAGIYNLTEPEAAEELGRRKAAHIGSLAVTTVAAANPGCLLQLGRYLPDDTRVVHPIELVDESIGQSIEQPGGHLAADDRD